jgi:hypothetical protein
MKFIKMFSLIGALGLILFGSVLVLPEYFREPKDVSVIPLTTNSWFYHGKKVHARGFLTLDFESYRLHLDKESYQQGLLNHVTLRLSSSQVIEYKPLDMNYVVVEGTFDATVGEKSFRGRGSIENVTRLNKIKE